MTVAERVARAVKSTPAPTWYAHINDGFPPPPTPPEWFGRWWNRWGDLVTLLGVLTAVSYILDTISHDLPTADR